MKEINGIRARKHGPQPPHNDNDTRTTFGGQNLQGRRYRPHQGQA